MKKAVFSMALCLILILSGCAQSGNEAPKSTPNSETPLVQAGSPSQSGEDIVTPIAVKQADWSSIQGKISGIYPAGSSKVLVLADQMSLYDLASGKIAATAQTPTLSTIRVWALDSGYAVVGQTISESSTGGFVQSDSEFQFRAVIYDENLMLKSEIDMTTICIRSRGNVQMKQKVCCRRKPSGLQRQTPSFKDSTVTTMMES